MRKLEVVPCNSGWPAMFEQEAAILRGIFGKELVRLHHIGSTSVPGLAAKPVIDMLAEVKSVERLDGLNTVLESVGYTPKGEFGIPGRRYFYKGTQEVHYFHIHAFAQGHPEVKRHLLFRNYLRAHPGAARKYGDLKLGLAARFSTDIEAYMDGKDAFIKETDSRAAAWGAENR